MGATDIHIYVGSDHFWEFKILKIYFLGKVSEKRFLGGGEYDEVVYKKFSGGGGGVITELDFFRGHFYKF